MKRHFCISLLLVLFITNHVTAQRERAVSIYEHANDAVVRILAYQSDGSMRGQGSGVIIKKNGWVITNYHVLGDASSLFADHKGKTIKLDSVIVIDREKDIMVLRLSTDVDKNELRSIPEIKLGNSDKLKVGQRVYALGSPLGFENTLTEGIISGLRYSEDSSRTLMQISAPISKGSSGGAILNSKGELIGISTMVISGETVQNLNFALLINEVVQAVELKSASSLNNENQLAELYFSKGNDEYNNRNYFSAILNFEKGIKETKKPSEISAFNFLIGKSYSSLNMYNEALAYFNRALVVEKRTEIYSELGDTYFKLNDLENAGKNYQMAITSNPSSDGYLGIGMIFYKEKDDISALEALRKCIQLNPMNFNAFYLLGQIAMRNNDYDKALNFFKQAIKWKPNYAEAYLAVADVYIGLNKLDLAAEYQQMAYSLKPELRESK